MANEPKPSAGSRVKAEDIRMLVSELGRVRTEWAVFVGAAALVSVVHLARTAEGQWTFDLGATETTIGVIALLWLPTLLQVLAIAGGSLKTSLGEASVGGLAGL